VVEAFLYHLSVSLPDDSRSQWVVLTPERRQLAEEALAMALLMEVRAISLPFDRALAGIDHQRSTDEHPQWYFAPAEVGQRLADMLPGTVPIEQLAISGAPGSRERLYYLQDDPPGADDGLLSLFCRRLRASLGTEGDWLQALLLQEAPRETTLTLLRRFHPEHLVVFDQQVLERFCANLTAGLQRHGRPIDILAVEALLTQARRRADRAWAGATAEHPIPFLEDVDKHLAITLAPAASRLPEELAERFSATETILPGLQVVSELGREYRFEGSAVHLIGHMGRLSATYDRDEAQLQGLDPEGWKGTSGLELVYDSTLHGVTGRRVRLLSAEGVRERIDAPAPGQDLRTTIDIDLQRNAEYALQHWYDLASDPKLALGNEKMRRAQAIGRGRAGLVVMDPWSGEILGMASAPGYTHEQLRQNYQALAEDPAQPLLDHSCTASQPPGSTVKILVAMAAFAEGVYRIGEQIHSTGSLGTMGDHAAPGDYDLARGISHSSNVFFANLALRMGPERLCDWLFRLGCARHTSPDIPWQRLQFVTRTPHNIVESRPREPFWTRGDTRRLGIGNFWASSPLEIAQIAACAATRGNVVVPHLVPGQLPDGSDRAEPRDHIDLTSAQWNEIQRGMRETSQSGGTAPLMYLETSYGRIAVAAKTGTSEWGSRSSRSLGLTPDHAWLMGYAPADKPVICFAIFIHSGISGGRACTAAVRHVLEPYFERYGPQGHQAAASTDLASTR
jgi:penicillin-binding protein 2